MRGLASLLPLMAVACDVSHDPPSPAPKSLVAANWTYGVNEDKMRKTKTWTALNSATNQAQLDFPYQGGTNATIQLTQAANEAPDNEQPILILGNGQLDCSGGCDISIKFDDGAVLTSTGSKYDCGTDQCINLNVREDVDRFGTTEYKGFHKRLSASKRLVIEVPIYRYGNFQFEFLTAGLTWPQPGARNGGV